MEEQETFLAIDWPEGQVTLDSSMEVSLYLIKNYKKDLGIPNSPPFQTSIPGLDHKCYY